MRNFNELSTIAKPYIQPSNEIPQNPFVLINKLNIDFKLKNQAIKDFPKNNPLLISPAILIRREQSSVIYFDENCHYWRFYVFHELAHHILKHTSDAIEQEWEANMLACCLIAPVECLPSYLRTAKDLSVLCQIPIDKAEEYWDFIYQDIRHDNISDIVNDYLSDIHDSINKLLGRVEVMINEHERI